MSNDKLILRVDHNSTYVEGKMSSDIYDKFKKKLGYTPDNAFWMVKNNSEKVQAHETWKKEWDGTISAVCWNKQFCHCHIKKRGLHFQTGLLSQAAAFLKENGVPFRRIDIRSKTEKTNKYSMSEEFKFRDYQQEVVDKVVGTEHTPGIDRGIIKAATGCGKTGIASAIVAGIGVSPTIFYVPSIDLLRQAKDELEKFVRYNGENLKVGMIGGGNKEIRDINVMTIQTAVRALGGVWVKFDDEDSMSDDTDINDIKDDIKELIYNSRLMIADECLAGDTLIVTEKGKVRISEVLKLGCKYVLSHDGDKLVWKAITAFMPKGKRKVLKIKLSSGKQIRCTSNHPFMTKSGWVESGDLFIGAEVFTCEQENNGNTNITTSLKKPHYVDAVAKNKLSPNKLLWNFLSNIGEMEKKLYLCVLVVIHRLIEYIQSFILMGRKQLIMNGLIVSEMLDWHGGFAMTEVEEETILDYIQKDSQNLRLKSFSCGCKKNSKQSVYTRLKENIIQSLFAKRLCERYRILSKDISQDVCNTNFETVVSIEHDGDYDVFDIEVEDTHCFFANGILVHNCQHWAAETCQIISDASRSCQYRYFLSATPYRDKGDDILIEGCCGRTIADINASFLIKKGWLVKPTIFFNKINNMRGLKKSSYANVYKQAIIENDYRNNQIIELANRFLNNGRKILILVRQIKHGKMLEELLPGSIFVHGSTGKKKRQAHLDKMREGGPQVTIASVIFDEGIDVRPLDTLILAGGGKSSTRALQRIGRILRPYEGKKDAIVVDFMDNCKYMQAHSKKRLSIYKTEEEFEIIGD